MQGIGSIAIIIVLLTLVWWYNEKQNGNVPPDVSMSEKFQIVGYADLTGGKSYRLEV